MVDDVVSFSHQMAVAAGGEEKVKDMVTYTAVKNNIPAPQCILLTTFRATALLTR